MICIRSPIRSLHSTASCQTVACSGLGSHCDMCLEAWGTGVLWMLWNSSWWWAAVDCEEFPPFVSAQPREQDLFSSVWGIEMQILKYFVWGIASARLDVFFGLEKDLLWFHLFRCEIFFSSVWRMNQRFFGFPFYLPSLLFLGGYDDHGNGSRFLESLIWFDTTRIGFSCEFDV